MGIDQFDVAIRLAAITVILFLAWLLFRQRHQVGAPAYLFAPLALCLSGFLAGNTPVPALRPTGVLGQATHLASGLTVVFLWWFCLSCFERRFRLRGRILAVGVVWSLIACLDRGVFGSALADKGLSYALIAIGYGIVAHIFWHLLSGYRDDLNQKRHDARLMVAVLLGGQLLVDLSTDVIFGLSWRPEAFAVTQNLAILGFGLWFAACNLDARPGVLAFQDTAVVRSDAPGEDRAAAASLSALRQQLDRLMEEERIFLDPDLSLKSFAARLQAPERTVRALISQQMGFDHFRSFLNHYRIGQARTLLADPARAQDKLISIAFDSGFASLATFNRVFREMEGCAPGQFRADRHKNLAVSGFE